MGMEAGATATRLETRERTIAAVCVVGIPIVAALITWHVLDSPPSPDTDEPITHEGHVFLDSARAIHAVAAVALMGVLAWISASTNPRGRPGKPTLIALGVAAVYLLVCLVVHDAFALIALASIVPAALLSEGWGLIPAIAVIVAAGVFAYVIGTRRGAPWLMLLGWIGLLVVLPGDMTLAWLQANPPLFN
jgi:hypothetical protein